MAVGCILPTVLNDTGLAFSTNTAQRPDWYDSIDFDGDGSAVDGAAAVICGSHADVTPIGIITQSLTGCALSAYAELFYNRVSVTPNPLAVGNLVADEQREITVFNGFFTDTDLDDIVATNLDGFTINATTPETFGPLQEITYTVDIEIGVGSPSINGSYLFDFESGIADITVTVTGNRVLSFPYLFQNGLTENIVWSTKVMTSYDGSEQRMKLRKNPVQIFNGNIAIPNGEIAFLDSLLYGWRSNLYGLPISSECRNLSAPTIGGNPTIAVNTDYGDFRVGSLAAIYSSPTDFELVVILSFTQTEIVATTNVTKIYPISAVVIPVRTARFLNSPKRLTNGQRQRVDFSFRVIDNDDLITAASATQYKGLDVYLEQPLTVGDYATDLYGTRLDVVSFSSGVEEIFSPWLKTKIQRSFGLQFESLEDVWNFRLWIMRREGKLRPFWMPTFEPNMFSLSVGAVGTQLIIVNKDQDSLSEGREDIAIFTDSGWLFRGIVSIAPIGNDLEVILDSGLGVDASEIQYISWMGRKRLSSDTITIEWSGNNTGNTTVPITEINN